MRSEPASAYLPCPDLWVITTYYNPAGYRTKRQNYELFAAPLREAGIQLITVECAFGTEPFELPATPDVLQVRGRDVMWVKERLINLAIAHLPPAATKITWLDADILFTNPDWARATSALLDSYPLVQPHDRVGRLARGVVRFEGRTRRSFASQLVRRPESPLLRSAAHGQPGIAWAARRDIIARYGLYDAAIIGGGDELFAHAAAAGHNNRCVRAITGAQIRQWPPLADKALEHLATIPWPRWMSRWYRTHTAILPVPASDERFFAHYLRWAQPFATAIGGRIASAPGMALHLWHGDIVNRHYMNRNELLFHHQFDPAVDIRIDAAGLWKWGSPKPELHQAVKDYFESRREDG